MKKKSTKKTNNKILEDIKSFWRGEWSLLQTFWGFFVVGNLIVGFIVVLLLESFDLNNTVQYLTYVFIYLIYLTFYIILVVGTWRSAANYAQIKNKRVTWSILAKIMVFLSIVNNIIAAVDSW
tara:strand:- start:998 stop:1366 length:369 start_codon:yes stop_codon:yes gene_type:complete